VRLWSGKSTVILLLLLLWVVPLGRGQTENAPPHQTLAPDDTQPSQQGQQRPISLKQFAPNFLHDQKEIWTFPAQALKGEHWKPTLALTGAVVGLVALDPVDTPYFRRTTAFKQFNKNFSTSNTEIGTATVPLAFYGLSLVRKDTYGQHTALLAGEAVAGAEILTTVIKDVDARLRPRTFAPNGDFDDSWFRAHGTLTSGRGSFPSGHAIAAFSVATVFADRYGSHRWVPWVAYGLAGVVGFSRVSLSAHFPSDVVAGAALAYVISHYVVLRHAGW
jgi:membrane-associated phospholipid phosphatase